MLWQALRLSLYERWYDTDETVSDYLWVTAACFSFVGCLFGNAGRDNQHNNHDPDDSCNDYSGYYGNFSNDNRSNDYQYNRAGTGAAG
jgi:hypothetical protein